MDEFKTLTEASVAADSVVGGIDDALATLRDPNRFYDYGQYLRAVKRLDKAFKLISAEWYPTVLSPNSFAMRWSIEREEDVLAAIADERENPYIEYFREVAIPRIARERPDLIGISITYGSMIIPAFTLARMIKEALPSAHITIGGGLLAYAGAKIAKSGAVFSVIDSIVLLEGEGPLLGIARAVAAGTDVAGVGNVIWKRDGVVVTNKTVEPLPIDALPTPDFDGLPLDRYVSPRIALPLAITRGCYYEKCVFCTLYKVIGPGYRQRNLAKILDDIEAVTTKYGSNAVYFVVEDMPPVLFRALPDALASRQLSIEWWTDARLEKNLYTPELTRRLYESGCRRIAFGFESASQRLLDLMDKGTAIAEASDIVKTVADAGIAVVLYTMIGFPSETEDEARATLAWIRAHQPWVQEVSLRIFYMDNLSQTYAHPERFGITRVHEDPTKQYQVYFDHDVSSGLTRAQARTIFFEFMEAVRAEFPLFKGDNLWLFELKSHHFLYLCRKGSLDVFQGRMTAHVPPPPPRDLLATKPRLAHDVVITDLPYDLGEITQTLVKAEDETLRPPLPIGIVQDRDVRAAERRDPARPTTRERDRLARRVVGLPAHRQGRGDDPATTGRTEHARGHPRALRRSAATRGDVVPESRVQQGLGRRRDARAHDARTGGEFMRPAEPPPRRDDAKPTPPATEAVPARPATERLRPDTLDLDLEEADDGDRLKEGFTGQER
jgi:anaerobic magnesium-protoporphyrin IX monomethyl ester cyclase